MSSFQDMIRRVYGTRQSLRGMRRVPPYLRHVLATDAQGFWVAESNTKVIGFVCSIVRGSIWFLCDFWIVPEFQNRGIGRQLLKRSLQSDRPYRITSTYSSLYPPAMRSYIMLGMTPQFPIYTLVCRSKDLKPTWAAEREIKICELDPTGSQGGIREAVHEMSSIDKVARGSGRNEDHELFIKRSGNRCWLAKKSDRTIGYFYISPKGQVGPLAVKDTRAMLPVLHQAIESAARLHPGLTIQIPSPNVESIRELIRAGFRIDSHAIFMSSREFGKMENYIISGPALF
ncbi:MAG: GNAT family N-acetyltransferase [Acidobacteriia bacterium]|nr:GNAT family N-acetyltransferase [Terriglobia bacterium]